VLVIYPDKKQMQQELEAKKQSSPTFVSHLFWFAAAAYQPPLSVKFCWIVVSELCTVFAPLAGSVETSGGSRNNAIIYFRINHDIVFKYCSYLIKFSNGAVQ